MSGGFQDLGLLPELVKATEDLGWVLPSDVQQEAIPLMLGGGDVCVAAETGSGKTGAFGFPALQLVHELRQARPSGGGGDNDNKPGSAAAAAAACAAPLALPSAVWSDSARDALVAVAPAGLTVQCRHPKQWGGVRGTRGIQVGQSRSAGTGWYWELTLDDEGLARVGWATSAGALNIGMDAASWGYGGTGKKAHGKKFDDYGEAYERGDVIGCVLVLAAEGGGGAIGFTRNGKWLGVAYELPVKLRGGLYPAVVLKNAQVQANWGDAPWAYAPSALVETPEELCGVRMASLQGVAQAVAPVGVAAGAMEGATAGAAGAGGSGGVCTPSVLVLEPAKDLAEQTAAAIESFAARMPAPGVRHCTVTGGGDNAQLMKQLARGADVVTATTGKLQDMVRKGKLSLHKVALFILDEADKLCDRDGWEDVQAIWNQISEGRPADAPRLQVCFFSATLHSPEIKRLSAQVCHHPTWVDLKGIDSVPDTVHHAVLVVDPAQPVWHAWLSLAGQVPTDGVHAEDSIGTELTTPEAWSEAVKRLKPAALVAVIEELNMEQVLVFCRTNLDCDNLATYLTAVGGGKRMAPGTRMESGKESRYSCAVLGGAKSMQERRAALQDFKEGAVRILIATDVAARGIDVRELPYVINMTLPDEPENYIHRVGRVGRAERMGLAISLVSPVQEKVWFYDKRRWKNKKLSTKLADDGGCCIWYDEPGLLAAVEARLHLTDKPARPVPATGGKATHAHGRGVPCLSSLALPQVTATLRDDGAQPWWCIALPRGMGSTTYGEAAGTTGGPSARVRAIASDVSLLSGLEQSAQLSYWQLASAFAGAPALGSVSDSSGAGTKRTNPGPDLSAGSTKRGRDE